MQEKRPKPLVKTVCVEHVCGGYLAAESSRDASCCVGSLNNSGITVKECTRDSRFKSQSSEHIVGHAVEESRPRLWTAVG